MASDPGVKSVTEAVPESVPEAVPSQENQVPENDHTTLPINTDGPIVADDFSVCAVPDSQSAN
jgi:hypothetical protein